MIGLLRFIRGFFGFIFAWQVLGVSFGVILLANQGENAVYTGELLGLAFIKIVAGVISGILYFWLRNLINRIYQKQNSTDTLLINSNWKL